MPERINKLQPDRTVHLRGFDSFAAAATIHSATPNGFKVSGTFRDPADFAVAVLYDADNFFEHPSIKYLPDFDFAGLTLNFDLRYSNGLQPIDSPKYNWIDWATLDCTLMDGTRSQVRLWDQAALSAGSFAAASVTCNLAAGSNGVVQFDRATLWYQNLAFDFIAPAGVRTAEFDCFARGTGTAHQISIGGRTYSHTESNPLGESSADQAAALIQAVNDGADPDVIASGGSAPHKVRLDLRPNRKDVAIPVSATDNAPVTMRITSPEKAAASIADQINNTNWNAAGSPYSLLAVANGTAITITAGRYGKANVNGAGVQWASGSLFTGIVAGSQFFLGGTPYTVLSVESQKHLTLAAAPGDGAGLAYTAPRGGVDGNLIELYAIAGTSTLNFDQFVYRLSGGSSDCVWHCSLDFTALGIDKLRQCWLTFAPSLVTGDYTATEWEATFSNWALNGDPEKCALKVAGPGSIRIEETDSACTFTGLWTDEAGFYSRYFAKATRDAAAKATVNYICQLPHNLYVGTSLYSDRAVAGVSLDGDAETPLDCRLSDPSAVATRRLVRANVPAGRHTVTIGIQQAGVFYFDFLEAAVLSDIPDGLPAATSLSPALDFDTDHAYKLSPARVMWIFDNLGYAGPMNEYLGVFWWNQRVRTGATFSTGAVDLSGTFAGGDTVFLTVNGATLGKSVFPADTPDTIAQHFSAHINGAFVGAWASATGPRLTITGRSPGPDYNLTISATATSQTGTARVSSVPVDGVDAPWVIDDTNPIPINRATSDWHADLFALCATRKRDIVTACSLELVYPPDGYAARYPDAARTEVATATGFGALISNHCAVGASKMVAYQRAVYRQIAKLQSDAGLVPWVQFGEFLWWYFEDFGGMAFYDDETKAAAQQALGRPLALFTAQDSDPMLNGGADARFLRDRLRDHVAVLVNEVRGAYPNARCEVLWPYDVNYPNRLPAGRWDLGGRLNRFVNLPVEWQSKPASGLDAMKVEGLAFATGMRNLDLSREAINLFPGFGWPLDSVRYLAPVFGSATPWNRELSMAREAGIKECNLWAFDHICLYNMDVPEKSLERRSVVLAG